MSGVLSQQLLLQLVDSGLIALPVQLGALFHGLEGSPALGVDNVRVLEGVLHRAGFPEGAAGLLRIGPGDLLDLRHNLIALRVGQHHVHAKAGKQADDALGDAQRLAVAGGVGPGHRHLFALQVLHAAHLVDDVEQVGHGLGGVVHITLEVDQGGTLLQDTLLIALVQGVHEGLLIFVALLNEHVVPDADDVGHKGDHVGRLPDRLAVGDLALFFVQVADLQAQQVAGGGKGEAGAGGVVPEDRDAQAGVKDLGGDIALPQVPQGIGHGEDGVQLVVRLVPGPVEVVLVHAVDLQFLQALGQFFCLAHVCSP